MTYNLTPRQDRIRVLLTRMERLDAELGCLIDAEREDEPLSPSAAVSYAAEKRQSVTRAALLEWAETAEFRARLMKYGKAS